MNKRPSKVTIPANLKGRLFTSEEAAHAGLTRYQLKLLIEAEKIEKLTWGIYRQTKSDFTQEDQFRFATLKVGEPSAIAFISALNFYDLTDIIPKQIWIMVSLQTRSRPKEIRVIRTRNPDWKIGIEKHAGYNITTVERTLIDALCYPKIIARSIALESLKRALQLKKTSLKKIWDMAIERDVQKRVQAIIEALS